MNARIFGKLCFTSCHQGGAAPLLDYTRVETPDGRVFWGRALLLTPWRRDKYREALPQRAVVVAWESTLPAWWAKPKRKKHRGGPPSTSGTTQSFVGSLTSE